MNNGKRCLTPEEMDQAVIAFERRQKAQKEEDAYRQLARAVENMTAEKGKAETFSEPLELACLRFIRESPRLKSLRFQTELYEEPRRVWW
jgi:hypothetical protein